MSEKLAAGRVHSPARTLVSRQALLHWITPHELEALRDALARGGLPADFLGKLRRLKDGDLRHHFIEQNCRLFAALLVAADANSFRKGTPAERERLLRVLVYVRKDDDAVPDYEPEETAVARYLKPGRPGRKRRRRRAANTRTTK